MTYRQMRLLCLAAAAAFLAACGNESPDSIPIADTGSPPDVGWVDAGSGDTGSPDTGSECPSERRCGTECCGPSQSCVDGKCEGCHETEEALCRRLGKECGSLAAEDLCGQARTVPSCGQCEAGKSCSASGTCVACKETDSEFCDRLKKNCGPVSGQDICGKPRNANCGSCSNGNSCDLGTNTCKCSPQSDRDFCDARSIQCGSATGSDNCGKDRTVSECGPCGAADICTAQQHCELCLPEADTVFCRGLGRFCGEATGTDRCGAFKTVANCGTCTAPKACNAAGACQAPNGPDNDDCSSPKILAFDATGKAVADGDTTNAVADAQTLNCTTVSTNGRDVVYLVDTTALGTKDLTATMVFTPAGSRYPLLYLRTVCDTTVKAEEIACAYKATSAAVALTKTRLAPGVYYLWADAGYVGDYGPFHLEVQLSEPPAPQPNDNCTLPTPLVFDTATGVMTPVTGNTLAAANDGDGTCASSTGSDVVYQFELSGSKTVEFRATPDAGSGLRPNLYVRRTCGDKASEVACIAASSAGTAGALTVFNLSQGTYYLWVDGYSSATNGPFTLTGQISDPTPAPNDTCATAQLVTFGANGQVSVPGDTRGAVNDSTASCATVSAPFSGNDVVYEFEISDPSLVTATVTRDPADTAFIPAVYFRKDCASAAPADEAACGKGTSTSPTATAAGGLQPGRYYVIVDGVSGSAGRFTLSLEKQPLGAGSCTAPVQINFPAGGGAVSLTGDTAAPGLLSANRGTCGTNSSGPEVVYTFTTSAPTKFSATVTSTGTYSLVSVLYLRSADCATGAQIACDYDYMDWDWGDYFGYSAISKEDLPAGTYYLFVDGDSATKGKFSLDVSAYELAPNDNCAAPNAAERLTLSGGIAQTTGNTFKAKNDGNGSCLSSSGSDLVYVFNNPVEQQVEVEVTPDAGSKLRANVYLRSSCADAASEAACVAAASTGAPIKLTVPRLAAGDWYVWVDSYSTGSSYQGPFALKVTTSPSPQPPSNDICRGAELLTFDASQKATVLGASTTPATNDYAGRCATSAAPHSGPDVVYTFQTTAPASITAKVTRKATTASFKPAVYLRKDDCQATGIAEQAACANDSSGVATATQVNAPAGTYFVIVDGISGTYGDFDLEVSLASAVNVPDSCFNAQVVDISSGSATVSGDTTQATNDGDGSCNSSSGRDVVYSFTTRSVQNVDITVTPSTGSGLRANVYVRRACDDKAAEAGCKLAPAGSAAALSLLRLAAGTWYVWVDGYSSSTNGPFTMTITAVDPPDAPRNDVCSGADPLVFNSGKATASGDTRYATNDDTGTCATTTQLFSGGDVVYQFHLASPQSVVAKVTRNAADTGYQPAVYIRRVCDSPASADEVACGKDSSGTATASAPVLAAGDYYVIVDGIGGTAGRFSLEVLAIDPVTNDDCSNPLALTFTNNVATVNSDTSAPGVKNDTSGSCRSGGMPGNDLVYKLDTTGMGTKNVSAVLTFSSSSVLGAVYLRSACASTAAADELACVYPAASTVNFFKSSVPAGVYYLWVDTYDAASKGAFTLAVTLSDAHPNDTCNQPLPLRFAGDTAQDFGLTSGAGNDYTGSCGTMNGADVVYSFSVPGPDPRSVTATVARDPAFTNYQPAVYIRNSNCTSAAAADEKGCGVNLNGTAFAKALSLTPGDYYLIVDGLASSSGAFDLHVELGPPEVLPDTCATAATVTLDRSGYTLITGDTTNATDAFQSAGTGCTTTPGKDLVYRIDTTGYGTKNFSASLTFASTSIGAALYLRGACADTSAANDLVCQRNTSGGKATVGKASLPEGVYYLIVDTGYANEKGPFTLEIKLSDAPTPPQNVSCTSAELLTLDSTGKAKVVSTTAGTTNDFTGIGSCASMTGSDTVYLLQLTQDVSLKATVTRDVFSSSFNPSIYLRRTCSAGAATDQIGCATHTSGVATLNLPAVPAGTYYLFVDGASASSGGYTLEVVTGTAGTRGDTCADPVALSFDASGVARVSGDTRNATQSGDGSCKSSSGYDLVYSMTLASPKVVDITVNPTAALYPNVYVRTACDSGELNCVTKTSSVAANLWFRTLQPGTYYIWVDGNSTSNNGSFDMTVTATDPQGAPANDTCPGIDLQVPVAGTVSVNGDTTWASHTAAGTCDSAATAPDVYYHFTLQQESLVTAKVARSTSSANYNPTVYLRRSCSSGAASDEIACGLQTSGTATAAVAKLPAGTYYVVVDGQTTTFGAFSLEVTTAPPLAGDTCNDAVELPPFDQAGVTEITADNSAATNASSGSCSGSTGMDLVYKFTLARPKKVDVRVTPSTGSQLKPVVYLRSVCNLTGTEFGCASNTTAGSAASLAYPTLGAGTYYVWVDATEAAAKGAFTLKVTAVDPPVAAPSNDTCNLPDELVFSGTPAKATRKGVDTTNAIDDSSGTCAVANGPDVVYRFVTTDPQKVTVKVTRVTSTLEPVVYIRAACDRDAASNEMTCVKHNSGTATAVVNNLPAGTWHVVVDSLKATRGTFDLEVTLEAPVTTGPNNENCYYPVPALSLSGGSAQVTGTTAGGQNDAVGTCSSSSATSPDVVYSVDVPQTGQWIKAVLTPGSGFAPALYLRNTCGSPLASSELACSTTSTSGNGVATFAGNLTAGTYFLWVDGGTSTAANASGTFTLDVAVGFPSVPTNDTCSRPEPLTQGVLVSADTFEATRAYGPSLPSGTCGGTTVKGPELVYSYTPTTSGTFVVTMKPTGFDAVLWYSEGTCDIASCKGKSDSGGAGVAETLSISGVANTTYYFFADGYYDYATGPFTIKVQ